HPAQRAEDRRQHPGPARADHPARRRPADDDGVHAVRGERHIAPASGREHLMRDELADIVYPVVTYALQVRAGLERGDDLDRTAVQPELRTLLKTANEAQRWPEYGGDGDRYLGIRYGLACWLDEIFILDSPWAAQWEPRHLEESLYGTNERAWKFWFQ